MSKQEYTVKQMAADDLKAIAAEVARAFEQHDPGTLPLCAAGLRPARYVRATKPLP